MLESALPRVSKSIKQWEMTFFLDREPNGEERSGGFRGGVKDPGGFFLPYWKPPLEELKPYGNIGYLTTALTRRKGTH